MPIPNFTLIESRWARWILYPFFFIIISYLLSEHSFSNDNGFDLTGSLIPADQIHHGGPPRDGIPSIDKPHFVKAKNVSFLKPNDRILGLVYKGIARAYPIKILNYHEIVNDNIQQQAIIISYCPLCGSGMAFKTKMNHKDNTFGVSGLLYNSDMLLYDRESESLWSQILSKAISGKMKGTQLDSLVLQNTTWKNWLERNPTTDVLSTDTGYRRDYSQHPYGQYDINQAIYFPVKYSSARFHPKERVFGITIGKLHKAYPMSELSKQNKSIITDTFSGERLSIEFDAENQSAVIYNSQHKALPSTTLFWFAWYAFHPETEIYKYKK